MKAYIDKREKETNKTRDGLYMTDDERCEEGIGTCFVDKERTADTEVR